MSYFMGTVSYGTTGVKTITVGFQPVAAHITVGKKNAASMPAQLSIGVTNGTTTRCNSLYADTSGSQSNENAQLVSVLERVSGTISETAAATFDSFTATQFKFNVTTANSGYQYMIEVWG
jgi:hypothetical protein